MRTDRERLNHDEQRLRAGGGHCAIAGGGGVRDRRGELLVTCIEKALVDGDLLSVERQKLVLGLALGRAQDAVTWIELEVEARVRERVVLGRARIRFVALRDPAGEGQENRLAGRAP